MARLLRRGRFRTTLTGALIASVMAASVAAGQPDPAPPYPPPPPPPPSRAQRPLPPPRPYYPPPQPVVAAPPPLSPLTQIIYAPFYAAGLVVRYGFYYLIVAPIEVFSRTVAYGARGGVEPPPPPPGDKT
jgi:hypothetical protein